LKFASISTGHVCVGSEYYGSWLCQPPQWRQNKRGTAQRAVPRLFLLIFAPPQKLTRERFSSTPFFSCWSIPSRWLHFVFRPGSFKLMPWLLAPSAPPPL